MSRAVRANRDPDRLPRAAAAAVLVVLASLGAGSSLWSGRGSADRPESVSAALSPLLDLNSATAAQLESLPMIGPRRAESIVADRARRGPFRSVDDLGRVHGIGPRTIERLRPFVKSAGD